MKTRLKPSVGQLHPAAFLLVGVLASCSKSSPKPSSPDAAGHAAAATLAPGGPGPQAPLASRPGPAGGESLAGAVAQVEQSFAAAKSTLAADDIETMVKSMAIGRQGLSRVNAILPQANLAPANLQSARAAAATLDACCTQAETALRTGEEVAPSQLQALAQQLDTAIASLKASTAGAP